jgi:hypothetical protein
MTNFEMVVNFKFYYITQKDRVVHYLLFPECDKECIPIIYNFEDQNSIFELTMMYICGNIQADPPKEEYQDDLMDELKESTFWLFSFKAEKPPLDGDVEIARDILTSTFNIQPNYNYKDN